MLAVPPIGHISIQSKQNATWSVVSRDNLFGCLVDYTKSIIVVHVVGKHIKKLFLYRNNCHQLIKDVWGCGDAPTCESCYVFSFFEFLKWYRILLSR